MTLTLSIIIITCAISFTGFSSSKLMHFGILRPYYTVRNKQWHQLLTSGFLHANVTHLFVNMITFYFFGTAMENTLGIPMFAGLYFFSILFSSLPSVIFRKDDPDYATLGASGGVEGVLFAFILLYPFRMLYVFLAIPMPAIVFGTLFIVYSIYESKQDRGQVNHEAHISGALAGILFMVVMEPGSIDIFLSQIGF